MRPVSLTLAAGLALLAGLPAAASGYKDRVHADSFGNLVIHSAAGYKRILVGQGYAADAYNLTGSYYEPEAGQLDVRPSGRTLYCHRPPHLWHGRSYMYGLPDTVVPQAPLVCE
jgi:hypothetical protein